MGFPTALCCMGALGSQFPRHCGLCYDALLCPISWVGLDHAAGARGGRLSPKTPAAAAVGSTTEAVRAGACGPWWESRGHRLTLHVASGLPVGQLCLMSILLYYYRSYKYLIQEGTIRRNKRAASESKGGTYGAE